MSTKEAKVASTTQSSGFEDLGEKCTKCGKETHTRKECQAIGHKCTNCNKKNHFEEFCRNPPAPAKSPVVQKSSKQTGQQTSKSVQHQTKAVQQPIKTVQQPSKATPPKTVQPSNGPKPEAPKPTDATPAAAEEKPVLTLKIGEEVAVKQREKPWLNGAKIMNVEEKHYEVIWRSGQKERVFHLYVLPVSAFDKFGNLKPWKVRDAEARGYVNAELVLEEGSSIRVREAGTQNFPLEGTVVSRAGDHYLIEYPDKSSSWEHHHFVKSATFFNAECNLIRERRESSKAESVSEERVNPELNLTIGTPVVVRDGATKIWNKFGTVVGLSGSHYLVRPKDGTEDVLKVFHRFVKAYTIVGEKREKNLDETKEKAAATGTKAEPVVQKKKIEEKSFKKEDFDEKSFERSFQEEKSEGKFKDGTLVLIWNPESKDYSKPGKIIKCYRGQYLIESKSGIWPTQTWENEGSVLPVNC